MSGPTLELPTGHCDDSAPYPRFRAAYDAIWKEGKPFVRNEGGVDILVYILAAIAPESIIMARSEYPQIFQHILELRASRQKRAGLVLIGHPGVGKTLFLYYALGAALAARIPVVLSYRENHCVLFDENGVHMIADLSAANFPCRTLFLVDSNSSLHSPPGAFLDPHFCGVIVQATTPEISRWRSWSEEVRASFWMSAPWKRQEILALQRVTEVLETPRWANPPPDTAVYTPVEVFDPRGPCARTCMHLAGHVKSQDGPQADFGGHPSCWLPIVFSELESVLRMVYSRQVPPDFYEDYLVDQFFFLYNGGPNPTYDGPAFRYCVPTPFLCRMLCAHLRSLHMASQLRVAALCGDSPSPAAPFYLPLALELLVDARRGHTCHVLDGPNFRIGPGLSLRAAPMRFDRDPSTGTGAPLGSVDDNTVLVVPPDSNAPFHALVVSGNKTRVTLLRFVALAETRGVCQWSNADFEPGSRIDRDRDRESISSTIHALSRVLPRPEEVRWSFVYAALQNGSAKKAAKGGAEAVEEMLEGLRRRVVVGWLQLRGRDKDTKALLKTIEKSVRETREVREVRRPRARGSAHRLGSGRRGSSVTRFAEEKGVFKSPVETKARCGLLPCLGL